MKEIYNIFLRYLLILFAGFGNLFVFYLIFTPITIYSCFWILSLFGDTFLNNNLIIFNGIGIKLVEACIAGSAYYLIFILVFSVRELGFYPRIKAFFLGSFLLLFLNIFRIILMALIYGNNYFSVIHLFFWYFVSILYVVLIWFFIVKIFKIKGIPVYSDINFLIKLISKKHA